MSGKGGRFVLLGTGLSADSGILSALEEIGDVGEAGLTGCLLLAAVEGLRSWCGEGWRLMEADWIADAMSMGTEDMASLLR